MHASGKETDRNTRITEIRTTIEDRAAATAIARRLVEQRLAACVQVDGPIDSVFRWQEAVDASTEWRLTVKTSLERAEDCIASILAQHPYELPELLVSEVDASQRYAAWVSRSSTP